MAVLYFIRHGETDWNAARRLQGQTDTTLNDVGRTQAHCHARVLLEGDPRIGRFDFVASPLARARQTMELVRSSLGLAPSAYRIEPRLSEIHLGDWQGYTWDENRIRNTSSVAARDTDAWATRAPGPGGESYADLSARVLLWFGELTQDTVAVSHGGVQRCLRGHLTPMASAEIPRLDAPQDKVLVLRGAQLHWI